MWRRLEPEPGTLIAQDDIEVFALHRSPRAWCRLTIIRQIVRAGVRGQATDRGLVWVVREALERIHETARHVDTAGYAVAPRSPNAWRGAHLPDDPKTILLWSRNVGLAVSTLKQRCQAAGVTAKTTLDLVRLLRIVLCHAGEAWDLQRRLDIVDRRTADVLVKRAGFAHDEEIPSLESFLERQRLVPESQFVETLRRRMLSSRRSRTS